MAEVQQEGPLNGLTVIDASTVIAGPLAATLLADYGARVIKLERPGVGDNARKLGTVDPDLGAWWQVLGRNKESVTCDLSQDAGRQLFTALVARADILIENLRPGVLRKWNLEFDTLSRANPGLIMMRVSGFGQDGPYSQRPGYGTLAEAMAGFAYVTGSADGPPTLPGIPTADTFAAFAGVSAVLMGLYTRSQTGRGTEVDMSLYGPMLYAFGMYMAESSLVGASLERRGTNFPSVPGLATGDTLRGTVRARDDKWVAYSVMSPRIIGLVADFLNARAVEDSEAQSTKLQATDIAALNKELERWVASMPRLEVLEQLAAAGIPVAPVYSALDMLDDPHYQARGEFASFPAAPGQRPAMMPMSPFRLDDRGGSLRIPAPGLGEHNDRVYSELLGLSEDDLRKFRADHVI